MGTQKNNLINEALLHFYNYIPMFNIKYLAVYKVQVYAGAIRVHVLGEWGLIRAQYICSAQSRNRYHSRMALRKVRIPTWLRKVGILTLRRAILEWSLRKVRIWTK